MNTIIEKIRAEVLRLIRETDGPGSPYGFGRMSACNRILNFLDTLQEQPVKIDIRKELASIEFMGVNDARDTETIARHFYELSCRRTAEKYDEIEYKRQRAEEDTPNDLEEAAGDYASDGTGFIDMTAYRAFIVGAKWDREQVMKEAVEVGGVAIWQYLDNLGRDFYKIETEEFTTHGEISEGDKVRIIILPKEEEK